LIGDQIVFLEESDRRSVKVVDVNKIDFDCKRPVRVLDLAIDQEGNMNEFFVDYSTEINKEFIFKAFAFMKKMNLLTHITDEGLIGLAEYPESFTCNESRRR
jgi:hypothetical protein